MSDEARLLDNPADFRAYLVSRRPGAIVGFAGSGHDCPTSRYAGRRAGRRLYGNARTYGPFGAPRYPTPAWAAEFIGRVERWLPTGVPVSREVAIAVLDYTLA